MDFRFVGSHNHMSQFCKPLSLPLWGHTHTHTHPLFFLFTWRIAVNTVGLGQVIRVCFLSPFSFLSLSFFFLWLCHVACGILVPWPGIEPTQSALEARSLSHWTAREAPEAPFLTCPQCFSYECYAWRGETLENWLSGNTGFSLNLDRNGACHLMGSSHFLIPAVRVLD